MILSSLQDLIDKGKSFSTVKVYLAAIAACQLPVTKQHLCLLLSPLICLEELVTGQLHIWIAGQRCTAHSPRFSRPSSRSSRWCPQGEEHSKNYASCWQRAGRTTWEKSATFLMGWQRRHPSNLSSGCLVDLLDSWTDKNLHSLQFLDFFSSRTSQYKLLTATSLNRENMYLIIRQFPPVTLTFPVFPAEQTLLHLSETG